MKKCVSLIISVILLSGIILVSASADEKTDMMDNIYQIIDRIIKWENSESSGFGDSVVNSEMAESAGSSAVDWFVFSMGRLGSDDDYQVYLSALDGYIKSNQNAIATDCQRVALTMLACGGDALEGGILDKAVFSAINNDNLNEKTVNALIYALIVLDSVNYEIPEGTNLSRSTLISGILCSRLENGSFALNGNVPDTDITAMVIQAFAPYYNSQQIFTYKINGQEQTVSIREAVDSAVEYLSSIQLDDGDMPTWGKATCESTAQTIIALCSLGINPSADKRFVKNGKSLIDGLMKYLADDGGFAHIADGNNVTSNSMATAQSLNALCSYCRMINGYRNLYDIRSEQGLDIYNKISSLIEDIELMDTDNTEKLNDLLNRYSEIPTEERFYVRNFYKLSDVLSEKGIDNTADYIADYERHSSNIGFDLTNVMTVRSMLNGGSTVLESPDSSVKPLDSEAQSGNLTEARTKFNWVEVIILVAIGAAAATVIILNHKKKK